MIPFTGFAPELDAMFGAREQCKEECHREEDKSKVAEICARCGFKLRDFSRQELEYMLEE